jgi:hypothetical protein
MSNARQAPLVPPPRYRTCTKPAYACSPQVATVNNNGSSPDTSQRQAATGLASSSTRPARQLR